MASEVSNTFIRFNEHYVPSALLEVIQAGKMEEDGAIELCLCKPNACLCLESDREIPTGE
jgi:hypothetical protein